MHKNFEICDLRTISNQRQSVLAWMWALSVNSARTLLSRLGNTDVTDHKSRNLFTPTISVMIDAQGITGA